MQILRVELKNIKSYREASIDLGLGTTAVRGHNGAGKSTLVEAIGFALFDALVYDQGQFVREGERYGEVIVTFRSAFDDREYQAVRRCGSGATWYVYDPELSARVAEQKTDVTDFLRRHLCVDSEIQLKDLFNDALGVPQGTFTADFLLTPAQRKKKFDVLLQVEEYRKAAESLADTRSFLQEQHHEQVRVIDALQRETDQLDGWREQLESCRTSERAYTLTLDRLEREAIELEARRVLLRQREAEVTRLSGAVQLADTAAQGQQTRTTEARTRLDAAQQAVAVCAETRPAHEQYVATENALADARKRERERNDLLGTRATLAAQLQGSQRDVAHLRTLVDDAKQASLRLGQLQPEVARQAELESQQANAKRQVERLETVTSLLDQRTQENEQLVRDIAATERTVADIEAARPEAAQRAARVQRLEQLQAALAARAEQDKRLRAVITERANHVAKREQLSAREVKARDNVRKIRAQEATVATLPDIERQLKTAEDDIRTLQTRIEHNCLAREQSGQGNCPFLREPCQNIRQRGENSLVDYFERLVTADEQALAPQREQLAILEREVARVREVAVYVARLSEYEDRLHQAESDRQATEDAIARLDDEQRELEAVLGSAPSAEALREAREQLHRSEEADRKLASLAATHERAATYRTRQQTVAGEIEQLQTEQHALAGASETLAAATAALASLGDPRGECTALARTVQHLPDYERRLASAEATETAHKAEIDRVDAALAPYVTLDQELHQLEEALAKASTGHLRYLRYEQLAATIDDRATELATAQAELQRLSAAAAARRHELETAQAQFDPQALANAEARAEALNTERGATTEALRQTQERSQELLNDIARVEALLGDLKRARDELAALEDLSKLVQQFRDTIKEAGPNVTKAVLRQISAEANRIFGEIMGDRSAQLSWEADYEIVLRRDGRERTFALLSGGEQMSAALAVRLALLRSLSRLDIAFFDEPTANMDGERRGNLAEQIRRVRGFDQLIVISHDDTFEQGLDSVIYLEKRGGETCLADAESANALIEVGAGLQ